MFNSNQAGKDKHHSNLEDVRQAEVAAPSSHHFQRCTTVENGSIPLVPVRKLVEIHPFPRQ
jgi:hypothetical protein